VCVDSLIAEDPWALVTMMWRTDGRSAGGMLWITGRSAALTMSADARESRITYW
jgi:hypothetical protein